LIEANRDEPGLADPVAELDVRTIVMSIPPNKSPLISKEQAFELGRKTSEIRISKGARRADLEFNIEVEHLHYALSQFYEDWKRGFREGLQSMNRGPRRGSDEDAPAQVR
jgi:hypothetical protein